MRRPALHHPLTPTGGWQYPYTGPLAHAVFYRSGDPTALPSGQPPAAAPAAGAPAVQPPAAPSPANMPGASGQPPAAAGGPGGDPAMVQITQDRLSKMMAAEKNDGRTSALRAIAEAAGLDPNSIDPAQVGTLLKQAQEASRQQMTEVERREADAKTASEQAARETATAQELARTASLQITLVGLGAAPDALGDVTAILRNDLAGIVNPTPEQITETAAKLKERRPTDFGGGTAPATAPAALPPAPGGAPAGGPPPHAPAAKDDIAARARDRAKAMGLPVKDAT